MRQINLVSIMGIGSIVRNTILWLSLGWALLAPCPVQGQDPPPAPHTTRVRRIKVLHADPQLIYLLLRGQATFRTQPEMSTGQIGTGSGSGSGKGG